MARTRSSGTENPELSQAQIDALKAQTGLTEAQIEATYRKLALEKESLGIERGKLDLGGRELTSKEQLGRLGDAITLLDTAAKTGVAKQTNETNLLSDLMRRPDVTADTLARTMAAVGHPELLSSMATDKATRRDALIRSMVPAIQAAGSDTAREKTIKPTMETQFPGSYADALALAYPKPGQEFTGSKPETVAAPANAAPNDQSGLGALASKLLTQTGLPTTEAALLSGEEANRAAHLATMKTLETNPSAYADPSVGALEGSTRTDLAGGLSQLLTPSGGEIRFKTPANATAERTLARFTNPQTTLATNVPAPTGVGALVPPPPLNLGALLNNNPVPGTLPPPSPTLPAPVIAGTPIPAPKPTLTPMTPQMLAALLKQYGQ